MTSTWLVADLQSKTNLQEQFLREADCLPEFAVLRASELWRHVLKNYFPEIDIVSPQFLAVWLSEWLKSQNIVWANSPGSSQLLLDYLEIFLPILPREAEAEKMREWLAQNSAAVVRWGHWYYLCESAWKFLHQQKILLATWVPGFLAASENLPEDFWPNDLRVDLGPVLTGAEAELLEKLARSRKIEVVFPSSEDRARYKDQFAAYGVIENSAQIQALPDKEAAFRVDKHNSFHRFASELGEVKAAVHWLRDAADRGVPLNQLGVFSASIEKYWPLLDSYLRVEGLPVRKAVVTPATSLPSIQNWLATLRIEALQLSAGDLEANIYSRDENATIPYERFAALFKNIYDEDDLSREPAVRRRFTQPFRAGDKLDRERFFTWALQFYDGEVTSIERVAAIFLQECRSNLQLEVRSWVRYVENLVSRIELENSPETQGGIRCGNLDAALPLELDTVVLLGLDAESIRPQERFAVSERDRERLARDLGMNLTPPGRNWSYWVEKIMLQTKSRCHACFALHDLMSRPQSPAAIWLSGSDADCEVPGPTRWDEIQRSAGEVEAGASAIKIEELPRLSPSQIEKYLNCPFQFAAEKIFYLSDLPDVDLDLDAATGGRVVHEILNRLLEPIQPPELRPRLNWTAIELERLVDQVRDDLKIVVGAQKLWPATRARLVKIAERFLDFEKNWRRDFPETETVLREGSVSGKLTLPGDSIAPVEISGRIDRVDKNSKGEYIVLDYKWSMKGDFHSHNKWIENNELQLLFYSYCLENGFTSLPTGPVLGAFYFTLREMDREKGFRDVAGYADEASKLFDKSRGKSPIEREELEKLYEWLRVKVAEVVTRMRSGDFAPRPRDYEICDECKWRTVCRAPHLI